MICVEGGNDDDDDDGGNKGVLLKYKYNVTILQYNAQAAVVAPKPPLAALDLVFNGASRSLKKLSLMSMMMLTMTMLLKYKIQCFHRQSAPQPTLPLAATDLVFIGAGLCQIQSNDENDHDDEDDDDADDHADNDDEVKETEVDMDDDNNIDSVCTRSVMPSFTAAPSS